MRWRLLLSMLICLLMLATSASALSLVFDDYLKVQDQMLVAGAFQILCKSSSGDSATFWVYKNGERLETFTISEGSSWRFQDQIKITLKYVEKGKVKIRVLTEPRVNATIYELRYHDHLEKDHLLELEGDREVEVLEVYEDCAELRYTIEGDYYRDIICRNDLGLFPGAIMLCREFIPPLDTVELMVYLPVASVKPPEPTRDRPNLYIAKSVDKNLVKIGDYVTVMLSIKNTGKLDALDVELIDTIPPGFSFVGGNTSWRGDLPAGDSVAISYVMRAEEEGLITLPVAKATYKDEYGRNYTSQSNQLDIKVVRDKPRIEALILMRENATVGCEQNVTIKIKNVGGDSAFDIYVEVYLPSGMELSSGSTETFVGELAPGEEFTHTFSVRITKPGELSSPIARISFRDYGGNEYKYVSESFRIRSEYPPRPRIRFQKNLSRTDVNSGSNLTVTIVAENLGDKPVEARIYDSYPTDGFVLLEGSIYWNGTLYPRRPVVLRYVLQARALGSYDFEPAMLVYKYLDSEQQISSNDPAEVTIKRSLRSFVVRAVLLIALMSLVSALVIIELRGGDRYKFRPPKRREELPSKR